MTPRAGVNPGTRCARVAFRLARPPGG